MESRISWGIIVTEALLSFASAISTKRLAAAPVSTGIDFIAIAMTVCCLLNIGAKVQIFWQKQRIYKLFLFTRE